MRYHWSILVLAMLLLAGCGGAGTPASTPVESTAPPAPATIESTVAPTGVATLAPTTVATAPRVITSASPPGSAVATPSAPPIAFGATPWTPGERTTYTIQDQSGQQAGQARYVVGREFDADSLSADVTIGQTQDRFQLGFNTKTLQPASETRTITTAQGTIEIRAEYHAGGATIEVTTATGVQRHLLNLPPIYYANDQFLLLLRALPFAPNYRGGLVLVPSQANPPTVVTTITVTGQETITTPLGPLRAWRVEADFGGSRQTLWYGVDAPHYLVKYDNGKYVYLLSQVTKP